MSRRSKGKSPQGAASSRNRWRSLGICVFLALAVWAVFGQTLHDDFVNYDDNVNVYENPAIKHGLSLPGINWAFTHSLDANWIPLTSLSHMLDCQLYELQPRGHHLTNVLLHAATVVLLFLILQYLTGAAWRSAFVAAVFAIHPLRVESVAWVSERKDVLSGLFFMLTLWAYARYGKESNARSPRSKVWHGWTLFCFALGLMSKPMLVTLPFVLLLLDYWPLNRLSSGAPRSSLQAWLRLCFEKIPFFLLSAAACVGAMLTQKKGLLAGETVAVDFPGRISNAVVACATYIWQLVYPVRLAVYYPHPGNQLSLASLGLSLLVLLMISAGALMGRKKHPCLLVGWLWYLGMLVPVSGLVQVGDQARADRYTYLPQIGLYLMVAWGAAELCGTWRGRRVALGSAAAAILAVLLATAHQQATYWKDSISLWAHALDCNPNNFLASNNLGAALGAQGKLAEAVPYFERAVRLKPDYASACYNLGAALAREGNLAEAIPNFERAVQIKPDYLSAQYDLGAALSREGKFAEAIPHFERLLQSKSDVAEAHFKLGDAFSGQGKTAEAMQHYRQALDLAVAQNKTSLAEAIRNQLNDHQPTLPEAQKP